jgi:hypothetical protein
MGIAIAGIFMFIAYVSLSGVFLLQSKSAQEKILKKLNEL